MHAYAPTVLLTIGLLLCDHVTAQETETGNPLASLKSGSAQDIATAISSLPNDTLAQSEIARQLTLLLNDERTVVEHIIGRETVSERAWFKLLDLPPAAATSILKELPKLETDRTRAKALEAVSRIGKPDRRAYEMILPFCTSDDVYLRSRAISALDAVADHTEESVLKFGKLLLDPDPMVKWTVLDALDKRSKLIDPVIPEVIKLLDDDSDVYIAVSRDFMLPEKLRGRAARLLAKTGPDASDAIPKLKTLIGPDHNKNVRIWSATAICKISESPPPEAMDLLGQLLLDDMDREFVQNDAPEAIAQLGPPARGLLDSLERAKKHASAQIRWELVDAFFAIAPDTAVSRSIPLMEDEDELVVETVIKKFSSRGISEPRVIAAYIRALEKHDGIFDQPASSAVHALAKLGSDATAAVRALELLAKDPSISDTLKEDVDLALERIR
ncbi:HEAT repeat domain-containing protein [Aureliella helgolandensis]|nr:HEAT repeat domain-containing protein [Aureliella helgolandensis]